MNDLLGTAHPAAGQATELLVERLGRDQEVRRETLGEALEGSAVAVAAEDRRAVIVEHSVGEFVAQREGPPGERLVLVHDDDGAERRVLKEQSADVPIGSAQGEREDGETVALQEKPRVGHRRVTQVEVAPDLFGVARHQVVGHLVFGQGGEGVVGAARQGRAGQRVELFQGAHACFGEDGAAAIRAVKLSYVTLGTAKDKLQLRLKLLNEALAQTQTMRKVPGLKAEKPPGSKSGRKRRRYDYDFCLSFASEDRIQARRMAKLLRHRKALVFYDENERHKLWGEPLVPHLSDIYQNRSRFCIMFTSAAYVDKMWPKVERKAAQARELLQEGYILPIKIDDTEIPGMPFTKGFMDSREHKSAAIADEAIKKLGEARRKSGRTIQPVKPNLGTRTGKLKPNAARKATLVMLGDGFYRETEARQAGDTLVFTVSPRNDAEITNLQNLASSTRTSISGGPRFSSRLGSGRGSVEKVETSVKGNRSQVAVTLRRESEYGRTISSGQLASPQLERQVRWVLFGEPPPQHERYSATFFDTKTQALLDAGVVKTLWEGWGYTKAEFVEGARLLLRFLLHDLAILDGGVTLNVGPWKKQTLPIKLKGVKRNGPYADDVEVTVSGELELTTKTR